MRAELGAALAAEVLKVRRSVVPWVTVAVLVAAGGIGTFFSFVLQDPGRARSLGVLGTKAQLSGSTADWAGHLALSAQIASTGGLFVFGLVVVWLFGREFADGTVTDLLALPTSRTAVVGAKLLLAGGWCLLLLLVLLGVSLAGGAALGLPGWSAHVAMRGAGTVVGAGALTIVLTGTYALAASVGRGYLPGVGAVLGTVVLAQVVGVVGFGSAFPYAVPSVLAGAAGPDQVVGWTGVAGVLVAGLLTSVATARWWERADQPR